MIRLIYRPFAFMLVALALVAGNTLSAADTGKVTLSLYTHYTSPDEKAVLDYALGAMKKVMPNVDVNIDILPQDDGVKLRTYIASGNMPDISNLDASQVGLAIKANAIMPLDSVVAKLNILDQLSATGKPLLSQQDGHTWAIPGVNTNFAVIYFNKALFKKAGAKVPENYEELVAAGKALKAAKITPLGIWLKEVWPALQLFDMASIGKNSKGITDLDLRGTGKASDPAFRDAAQKLSELGKLGIISRDAFTMDYNQAVSQFASGQSAMLMCGNWMMQEFGEKLGSDAGVLLPYVFANAAEAKAVKAAGALSGGTGAALANGFAVSSKSPNKEIASMYAVQLALKIAEGRTVKTGEINTYLKTAPTPEKEPNALIKQAIAILDTTKSMTTMGWAFESPQIQTDLGAQVQKLYTGAYSPDDFAKTVDKLLEKYRK